MITRVMPFSAFISPQFSAKPHHQPEKEAALRQFLSASSGLTVQKIDDLFEIWSTKFRSNTNIGVVVAQLGMNPTVQTQALEIIRAIPGIEAVVKGTQHIIPGVIFEGKFYPSSERKKLLGKDQDKITRAIPVRFQDISNGAYLSAELMQFVSSASGERGFGLGTGGGEKTTPGTKYHS
jgi:hypothetical protein